MAAADDSEWEGYDQDPTGSMLIGLGNRVFNIHPFMPLAEQLADYPPKLIVSRLSRFGHFIGRSKEEARAAVDADDALMRKFVMQQRGILSKPLRVDELAVALAASSTAYEPDLWRSFGLEHHDVVKCEEQDLVALIGATRNFVIVAVRGSETRKNWKRNFEFTMVQGVRNEQAMARGDFDSWTEADIQRNLRYAARVHKGFMKCAVALWRVLERPLAALMATANTSATAPLLVTGHSLGGAIATLLSNKIFVDSRLKGRAAAISVAQGAHPLRLITFGQPRVGNAVYIDCLAEVLNGDHAKYNIASGSGYLRVHHCADSVVGLPAPSIMPGLDSFVHGGKTVDMTNFGRLTGTATTKLFDHEASITWKKYTERSWLPGPLKMLGAAAFAVRTLADNAVQLPAELVARPVRNAASLSPFGHFVAFYVWRLFAVLHATANGNPIAGSTAAQVGSLVQREVGRNYTKVACPIGLTGGQLLFSMLPPAPESIVQYCTAVNRGDEDRACTCWICVLEAAKLGTNFGTAAVAARSGVLEAAAGAGADVIAGTITLIPRTLLAIASTKWQESLAARERNAPLALTVVASSFFADVEEDAPGEEQGTADAAV